MNDLNKNNPWGRVDDANNVYVKDSSGERIVGQFPAGTAEEALAYFVRKFNELEGKVRLTEQRIASGAAGSDIVENVQKLTAELEAPAAVGDLDSLRNRVAKLQGKAEEFVAKQQEKRAAEKQAALELRESIVQEAEAIAQQPEQSIRWKDSSEKMEGLFAKWQASQRKGPNIGKAQADALWKRFRTARNSFETARRRFFAEVDASNKAVKHAKEALITKAEALAGEGANGINTYRNLLEDWKRAGRASKKIDDQLWARFKAAGDVLYGAKAEEQALLDAQYEDNLKLKLEILERANAILDVKDHEEARKQLTPILEEWDAAGRVPRASVKSVEDKIRKIEKHVQKLEDDHWAATNPETIARSEGLRGQLEDSIASLNEQIKAAEAAGDAKNVKALNEQLETQKSWLAAIN